MEAAGNESPPSRTTILGSFLRGRPRNSSQSHIHVNTEQQPRELSPSPPQPPSPNPITGRRRPPIASALVQPVSTSAATPSGGTGGLGFSNMLRRRRSAGNVAIAASLPPVPIPMTNSTTAPAAAPPNPPAQSSRAVAAAPINGNSPAHRIKLVPHLDNRRNLRFEAISRDLREGDPALRIGRFTDRSGLGLAAVNALNSNKLAFKSKVVSRAHAEIWAENGGKFYIKDTKSSSGTFLNHVRLSPANTESRPYQIKDGDILQLGVDYQGGTEDIYKSVKIRLELGREWQSTANAFNTAALKNLKALAAPIAQAAKAGPGGKQGNGKTQLGDCCICLFPVTIRQALFITPCSHTFHYKCIRPLLETHHPGFSCPLCRTFADLEEDVEVEAADIDIEIEDSPPASEIGGHGEDSGMEANGELVPPARETGAETEVEGEGSGGVRTRRGNQRQSMIGRRSPFADDPAEVEEHNHDDDDLVMIDGCDMSPEPMPGRAMIASGSDMDDELGVAPMEDVEGTVGGKRKR